MRMNAIKNMFNDDTMHIEKARGNPSANKAYCSKENDFFEYGEMKTNGKDI